MEEQRSLRPAVAIGGLLALIGVVAVAAAGRAPGAGESRARPSGDAPQVLLDYIGTLAVLIIPAGALLLVFSALARKSEQARTGKRRSGSKRLIIGLLALALGIGGSLLLQEAGILSRSTSDRPPATIPEGALTTTGDETARNPGPSGRTNEGHVQWLAYLVLGSLLLAFGAAGAVVAWRRKYGTLPERPMKEVLTEVLGETLDDLRNEPDPRRAVIRAYARMERTLAARGFPRHAFEAPLEYLARVLDVVQASAHSVKRLTKLFERARFSPHEIDARMKDDAIEALAGLRAELEAAR